MDRRMPQGLTQAVMHLRSRPNRSGISPIDCVLLRESTHDIPLHEGGAHDDVSELSVLRFPPDHGDPDDPNLDEVLVQYLSACLERDRQRRRAS